LNKAKLSAILFRLPSSKSTWDGVRLSKVGGKQANNSFPSYLIIFVQRCDVENAVHAFEAMNPFLSLATLPTNITDPLCVDRVTF